LIIYLDADIFSSILYVLTNLDFGMKKNDLILINEFTSITREFKAFTEYGGALYCKFAGSIRFLTMDEFVTKFLFILINCSTSTYFPL